ncbi:unnamed protein product [Owenia fusiformis]|uniref:Uncharacterized protein n=1 Tax=Owenia fusiformis TaxID=6347 RepID=A0A8J1UTE3_OWEFU|nr:unnamed protein product [Owenia fusiformis]
MYLITCLRGGRAIKIGGFIMTLTTLLWLSTNTDIEVYRERRVRRESQDYEVYKIDIGENGDLPLDSDISRKMEKKDIEHVEIVDDGKLKNNKKASPEMGSKEMAPIVPEDDSPTMSPLARKPKIMIPKQFRKMIESNANMYKKDLKGKKLNKAYEKELHTLFSQTNYTRCSRLIIEAGLRHDVKYFAFPYKYEPSPVDVTLMSHLTLNRGYTRIAKILAAWPGPVSFTVFGTDEEIKAFLKTKHTWKRKNVGIHAIYQGNDTKYYPVNYMRNIALYATNTSHVWMIDADFTPNQDAYKLIKGYIPHFNWTKKPTALVSPAFETYLPEGGVPANRAQLMIDLKDHDRIETFSFRRCPRCHNNTNWPMFFNSTKEYKIKGGGTFEPYLVVHRKSIPVYDERFVDRHWNKILYDYELYALQYEFYVLPDVFIVHEPHERIQQAQLEFECLDVIGKEVKRKLLLKKKDIERTIRLRKRSKKRKKTPSASRSKR